MLALPCRSAEEALSLSREGEAQPGGEPCSRQAASALSHPAVAPWAVSRKICILQELLHLPWDGREPQHLLHCTQRRSCRGTGACSS